MKTKITQSRLLFTASALASTLLIGCSVEKTADGRAPDVDVDAEAGQMPNYKVVQTQEGKMPDVDVDVDAGKLPEYDVELADVDVNTEEETVMVPKVVMVEEEVSVPNVDVTMPSDQPEVDESTLEKTRGQMRFFVAVPYEDDAITIQEVIRDEDTLHVIATVNDATRPAADPAAEGAEAIVASATIPLTVTPDTDIEYYLVTSRDDIDEVKDFDFERITSRDEVDVDWNEAVSIYTANGNTVAAN